MIGTEHIRNDIFRIWPEEAINKKQEDDRKRVYLTPTRVLWKTDNSEAKVVNSDVLTEKRSPQISLEAKNPCIMVSQKGYASVLKLRRRKSPTIKQKAPKEIICSNSFIDFTFSPQIFENSSHFALFLF